MAGGRAGTWGFGVETTPGTAVTPTRWLPFVGEGFQYEREKIVSNALRGETSFMRHPDDQITVGVGVTGSFSGELRTRGMGLLLQHMLGTVSPVITQQGATTAYLHSYVPGTLDSRALTIQKRVPFANSSSASIHTYRGCKVTSWEIACSVGEIATISCDFDGMDETTSTAYTTPTYTDAALFSFKDGAVYTGGTVSVADGVASRTGGTAIAAVTGVTISGNNNLKTDSRYLGNSGVKGNQTDGPYREVSGSLETEFVDMALYDQYRNDSESIVDLRFVSPLLAGTGFPCEFRVLLPVVKFTGETPTVGGPDVVTATAAFEAFQDTGLPGVQFQYQTADTTA